MRSIRRQLTQQLVLGTLLIAGCSGAAAYLTMRAAVMRQFDESLLAKARALCSFTSRESDESPKLDPDDARSLGFTDDGNTHFFEVRPPVGESIAHLPNNPGSELPRPDHPGSTPEFHNLTLPGGAAGRSVTFTFIPHSEDEDEDDERKPPSSAPAFAVVTVASNRQPLDTTLHTLLATFGLSTGLLIVSAWVLVPRVLRRGLRPLDELADRVKGITADSLSTRFPESGAPSEIAPIALRLNDLLVRIDTSFERERRFSADLAHELRTPLAELHSMAELVLKWPDARATTADADTLAITLRMEHLVTRLLALARAEGGHTGATRERVMVGPAVQSAWRPFAEHAAARNLLVEFRLPLDLSIKTDPTLLREILTNLFSNAVDYTPEGGTVETEAVQTESGLSLRVTNTVRGLDAMDVENMFDRFWRKEAARSDNEHAGLGLALARSYATVLDYNLSASLDNSSHLTFTLNCGTA